MEVIKNLSKEIYEKYDAEITKTNEKIYLFDNDIVLSFYEMPDNSYWVHPHPSNPIMHPCVEICTIDKKINIDNYEFSKNTYNKFGGGTISKEEIINNVKSNILTIFSGEDKPGMHFCIQNSDLLVRSTSLRYDKNNTSETDKFYNLAACVVDVTYHFCTNIF